MANNKITTTALDFDSIKSSLKTYLQGQEQFSDYDFDGSGLSILLDVLAYNTHYNALYTNLAINEAFLDSAAKRSSVVSRAKELGYIPRSSTSSTAVVNVVINVPSSFNGTALSLNAYSQFGATVEGNVYAFYNTDTVIAYRVGNSFTFNNISIREGNYLEYSYTVEANASYVIPNGNVDLSSLKVIVQENAQSSVFTAFQRSDVLIDLNPNSAVYFVKELDNLTYELEFGNGILGKALEPGNYVTVNYLVCNAYLPNGARRFTYNGGLPSGASASVTTVSTAAGGTLPEDLDSIKWNAPRQFAAQNRCVTLEDYKTIIQSGYPNIDSINVWGGEDNIPPSYGDVYISIKPSAGVILSAAEQDIIINNVLGPRKIVTVHPKLVDPAYLFIDMTVSFYYDTKMTTKSAVELSGLVTQTILNYNQSNLERFDGVLKYSQLTRLIDATDPSITNSIVTLIVRRPVEVVYNEAAQYLINLANPIYNSGVPEESVLTTGFVPLNVDYTCYIEDVPTAGVSIGALRMFYYLNGKKTTVRNVGTVNYNTGVLSIQDIIITSVVNDSWEFKIKTQSNDVVSSRNQIVAVAEENLKVTPIITSTADNYKFTSSRN